MLRLSHSQAKKNKNGAVLPIVLGFIFLLLGIVGFLNFLLFNSSIHLQAKDKAKVLALTALSEYAGSFCNSIDASSTDNQKRVCHRRKLAAAVDAVNRYADQPGSILFGFGVGSPLAAFDRAGVENYIYVQPAKYYTDSISCQGIGSSESPCLQALDATSSEFANAFQITGKAGSSEYWLGLDSLFDLPGIFKRNRYVSSFTYRHTAVTIPLKGFFVLDFSTSVAEVTSLPRAAIYPPDGSESSWQSANIPPSLFSYIADETGNVKNVIGQSMYWSEAPLSRDTLTDPKHKKSPFIHPQDDYVWVQSVASNASAYNNYPQKSMHPIPGSSPFVNAGVGTHLYDDYRLDLYRSASETDSSPLYLGAEPYLSILKGVEQTIRKIIERGVPSDEIGLVASSGTVLWSSVVNLGRHFKYIEDIVDIDEFKSEAAFQRALANEAQGHGRRLFTGASPSTGLEELPLWVKLGFFPRAVDNIPGSNSTNPLMAYREAIRQLSVDTSDAVKFITGFSDGLMQCYNSAGDYVCADDYDHYESALRELNDFVTNTMGNSNTALNMMMIGRQIQTSYQARTKTLKDHPPITTDCATDAEARALKKNFVRVFPLDHSRPSDQFRLDWFNRFEEPLEFVNGDWYNAVRATGGEYFQYIPPKNSTWYDLNPNSHPYGTTGNNCNTLPPSCGKSWEFNDGRRYDVHPKCSDLDAQIRAFVDALFNKGSNYVLVDLEGDQMVGNFDPIPVPPRRLPEH